MELVDVCEWFIQAEADLVLIGCCYCFATSIWFVTVGSCFVRGMDINHLQLSGDLPLSDVVY